MFWSKLRFMAFFFHCDRYTFASMKAVWKQKSSNYRNYIYHSRLKKKFSIIFPRFHLTFVSNKLISYPIIFLVCTRYRFLFPTEISSMPFRSTMRDKIRRNEENGSHLLGEHSHGTLFHRPVESEGWNAISVINKVHTRESRTLVSRKRVPISAAATPVVALLFRKMLPGFWKANVYPIDMQTKFWIVKLAQYRGVFAIPASLSSSPLFPLPSYPFLVSRWTSTWLPGDRSMRFYPALSWTIRQFKL